MLSQSFITNLGEIMSFDLHCHTKMSDGSTSIDEVLTLAQKKNLTGIAITDHDTFAGSTRGVIIGKRMGINVIPGVEISAMDYSRNKKTHILCYMPTNPNRLEGTLKKTSDNRRKAMMISIQKVMCLYNITAEMVLRRSQGSTNIFKQHIMQTLMETGYTNEMFGDVYSKLFNPRIGFANTKIEYPKVEDVINEIHDAGGVAVLAHPSEYKSMELFEELCAANLLDGVELNHPSTTDEDARTIVELAAKNSLFVTGGTDFHGCYSPKTNQIGTHQTEASQILLMKKAKKKYNQ